MPLTVTRKRNDTAPPVRLKIRSDETTLGFPLDGAAVTFIMSRADGTVKVNAAAVVEAPASDGIVRYDFAATDLDEAGVFDAEFQLDFGGGDRETHPDEHYIRVIVEADLEDA